ncbi:MMPL family transporter [Clavibacter sepedonicus]|uniref:Integral membrane protein n=1 Tax=Clavibacter sepedonicus TaxID=31964 RepID=B0RBU0_CLASE|nr:MULTISPECIES: MMPL family transporter [Clavibacter]MBD5380890.1 MMPL family transporter [Clavibacter sp.]OQJ48915.1 RND transporter [Clavibacter sepedonicus]OQJ53774.1 RND transporter [Clavibacter sepedonicus]UUK65280.1 MMPL family transporter [Clavibacter sepedonicus]CAQ00491.1 putative integral membrane protein [Clavibacter sepedonicus]
MASVLYRLGSMAARRAWLVIVSWVVILGIGVGSFLAFAGTLGNSFDIPGTASGAVTDELAQTLPDTAGGTGTVVYRTTDGSAFTDQQKQDISALATSAGDLPGVARVVDPFAVTQQRADQAAQLQSGDAQITAGRTQLDAAQQQLDAGKAQLDAGQQQLTAARQQAEAAGAPAAQIAALDAQQAQLDQQTQALQQQQATVDSSRTQLESGAEQAELGRTLLGLTDGIGVVSADGSTAIVNVSFTDPRLELSEETKESAIAHFQDSPVDGTSVDFATDLAQGVPEIFGIGEVVGLVFAAIVLIVMLGTLIAASLPIVTAVVGVGVGVTASLAFSGVVDMASVTPVLGVMLGLAVGIDYSLFIVNRHRKQMLAGTGVRESIGLANGTSGTAVVFAGSTVIVALLALNITGVPFLALMGTVGAVCVLVAVLVAITLTPAVLGLAGTRVLRKRDRASASRAASAPSPQDAAKALKPMSNARAVLTVVGTVVALLVVAIPSLSMRLGLPDGSSEPAGSTSERAFSTVADEFGEGANGPLLVVADVPAGLADADLLATQVDVAQALHDLDDVVAVAPVANTDDNTVLAFQVLPQEGPNSASTEQLVQDIRALPELDGGITLGVAGQAATNIDISEALAAVLPLYLLVVVGLSLLILIVVFRSILLPLIATGGFVLSLFATYGLIVAVFQFGWGASLIGLENSGPILSFLPVILVGILFGLAMDYQLFLASGMREAYVHGAEARLAVVQGLRAGRAVVTAAALIMVSVFGGFVFSESTIIRSIGFGLAFGVLLDAFVVRMLLMPALMHLLGRSAWWLPRWLDRILPDVDIEGAALERTHPHAAAASTPAADLPAGLPADGGHGAHAAPPTATTIEAETAAAPRD